MGSEKVLGGNEPSPETLPSSYNDDFTYFISQMGRKKKSNDFLKKWKNIFSYTIQN